MDIKRINEIIDSGNTPEEIFNDAFHYGYEEALKEVDTLIYKTNIKLLNDLTKCGLATCRKAFDDSGQDFVKAYQTLTKK